MEALNPRDVTLVDNDTRDAIYQIVVAEHPERIGCLVLTNCDAYEAFFPLLTKPFQYGARLFGERFSSLLAWALKHRPAQRLLLWPSPSAAWTRLHSTSTSPRSCGTPE